MFDVYLKFDSVSAWARYLFWADLATQRLDSLEDDPDRGEWPNWWKRFAFISHACAAEYVVIEGWRNLGIKDAIIDSLLLDHKQKVELLRRYRNGVFHCQESLVDVRMTGFIKQSEETVPWLIHLHAEFLRFYWAVVEDFPGNPEQKQEFREAMLHLVGWIPSGIFPARRREAENTVAQVFAMTEGDESKAAIELRASVGELLKQAQIAEKAYGEGLESLYTRPRKPN